MAHVAVAVPVTTNAVAPVRVTSGSRLKPLIPALALSPGVARPYGVNLRPETAQSANYFCVYGDGATQTWSADDGFEAAGNAVQLNEVAVIAPAALRVICTVNGVPIINSGTDVGPGGGEFHITAAANGTLAVGSVYAAGTKIELYVCDAADVVDVVGAAMVANTPEEIRAYDVMGSAAAAYSVMI